MVKKTIDDAMGCYNVVYVFIIIYFTFVTCLKQTAKRRSALEVHRTCTSNISNNHNNNSDS